jgi:hypothetical protein
MKHNTLYSLIWSLIGLSLFFIFHFLQKNIKRKNIIEKEKIKILKKENLNVSYSLRENWNKYMNTYINNLIIMKWVFLVISIFILVKDVLFK